ncbi:MAG: S8 family serine peptidase [Chloroflexia bacterium]|nr:S8 family serine peptidase [Chloroflexia bacterium]
MSRLVLLCGVFVLLVELLPIGSGGAVVAAPATRIVASDEVIVVLRDGVDPVAAARELGVEPTYIYRDVFSGFAGRLPAATVAAASRSSLVELISPDAPLEATRQVNPTGVRRIRAKDAWADPVPDVVNADVAVLDTGIQRKQAPDGQTSNRKARDLNVRNGKNCIGSGKATKDGNGHGTHIAGTVGARDNSYGVVGVAPGVRLHAVKVLNADGVGSVSSVVCGLDWVYRNRGVINVVNMSLGDRGDISTCANDAFHRAVCRVVDVGIAVVVASGNQGEDAANFIPANFPEVITVSAYADSDGKPGGEGDRCGRERDDTYASFSNFGQVVDIAAPGVCIRSTRRRGGTVLSTGTSQAAPHVAGALALYFAANPEASPNNARIWLLNKASVPQDDPDGGLLSGGQGRSDEPVLWLDGVTP